MKSLDQQIREHVAALPTGVSIRVEDFLHIGSKATGNRALARLERSGVIVRIARGVYVPLALKDNRPLIPSSLVEIICRATGETIATHGAAAANMLGLTTQVPIRLIYLTSGPSRRLMFGRQIMELRHAPAWQLLLPWSAAGDAMRALSWDGAERVNRNLTILRRGLSPKDFQSLVALRRRFPRWLGQAISRSSEL